MTRSTLRNRNTAKKELSQKSNSCRKISILLFWLILWQLAAVIIDNDILFVHPFKVLRALVTLIQTTEFWASLFHSCLRIGAGFLLAFLCGLLLGSLAYRSSFIKELSAPVFLLAKSVPVASFVILALIWMGSENLSVFISFLVVLPMVYSATLSGLENADPRLLELAFVFRMPLFTRIRAIYIPALLPYLETCVNTALGMSIKSGIAAEVIGVPDSSIGEHLYLSKVYLDTAELFAWTIVIIVITSLFERGVVKLLRTILHKDPKK